MQAVSLYLVNAPFTFLNSLRDKYESFYGYYILHFALFMPLFGFVHFRGNSLEPFAGKYL